MVFINAPRRHAPTTGGTAESRTQRLGSETHEAVAGSSATVGGVLVSSAGSVGRLVTHPLTTQGVNRVERTHTTSTDGNVTLGNVGTFIGVVRTQTRTTGGVGLSQSRATATGGGRLENGHLHFLTSSVKVSSDGGEVGDGSGHVSDVFDSFKLQENGGQVNTPGPVCQVSTGESCQTQRAPSARS